jgi:hypothetical protein
MKKSLSILTIISILLNIGLIYFFVFKGETVTSSDSRTAVVMSPDNTDFVLDEMRDFLESVQQINEGILHKDARKIIDAGKRSGGSVIDHAPKGLIKTLPLSFKNLGFETHDIFDEIRESAENDFNPKKAQIQLNKLLYNCTACHRSFKIETSKD